MESEQTARRFRVCNECDEQFSMVRGIRHHQNQTGHEGIDHITAEVQE
jgi:hypothetical protein